MFTIHISLSLYQTYSLICRSHHNTITFSSIDHIPSDLWKQLGCENHLYFRKDYLKALEVNNSAMDFSYIFLLNEDKEPIAFSTLQIIDFDVNSIKNDLERMVRKLAAVARKIKILPKERPLKFLISGNVFVSGEHGIFIKEGEDKNKTIKELAKGIQHFANDNKDKKIAVFILKDFIKESLFISDELLDFNYYPIQVEPNMTLTLQDNWHTFDDYLAALKTKFRVKARKAFKQSNDLVVKTITQENIEGFLPKMDSLYKKVVSRADFNFGDFDVNTYKDLVASLGDQYVLQAYFLNDVMVGFMSGAINNKTLDAHFVGIDYRYNRRHAIYQRMLYDYIRIAIDKRVRTLNFARTASEIKSSVGAIPQDLTIYIRHKKSITNRLLQLFLTHIQPTKFNQKFPFKSVTAT